MTDPMFKQTCLFFAVLLSPLCLLSQNFDLYQPEVTASFLANRTIDVSRPVGVVEGTPAVTGSGGAAYTIPLVVAPGTQGVQPSLGLVYNSQSGDGPLGWGWQLSGLSAITRTGTDWYHENGSPLVRGLDYGSNDRFLIDGERLVGTSGNYGANNSTYDTEQAAFSVYTSYGSTGGNSGPLWFSVVTKAGMYMEFGGTPDSRINGNGGVYS
jgi:hypothetical protein